NRVENVAHRRPRKDGLSIPGSRYDEGESTTPSLGRLDGFPNAAWPATASNFTTNPEGRTLSMRLLVSVASAAEALAALGGGADVVDAKDPHAGALGAVSAEVLHGIRAAIAGARPLSAALGDAIDEATIERDANTFVAA